MAGTQTCDVLHLHHRYRTLGGEEQAISNLRLLSHQQLNLKTELLERDSALTGAKAAGLGLLSGGTSGIDLQKALGDYKPKIVHAHNLLPTFGWRALAAAKAAGAATVLSLHNYRLVCAVGTCIRSGGDCVSCQGTNTLPGLLNNCRGSLGESAVYAAGIARQQRALLEYADLIVMPSQAALDRLLQLKAPIPDRKRIVIAHSVFAGDDQLDGSVFTGERSQTVDRAGSAVITARLSPEKGVDVAIEAARITGLELLIANSGPSEEDLRKQAADLPNVQFVGRLERSELVDLRRSCSVELVPSLAHETFGLAAAEAVLLGVPVVASRVGALPELLPSDQLVDPGDPIQLAEAWLKVVDDHQAVARQQELVIQKTSPDTVAKQWRDAYSSLPSELSLI